MAHVNAHAPRHRRRTGLVALSAAAATAALAATVMVGTADAQDARTLDPTAAGPHSVGNAEYNLGDTAFQLGGFKAELRAAVNYPTDVATGTHPLVVLLHGLFATCSDRAADARRLAAEKVLDGPNRPTDPAEVERLGKVISDANEAMGQWPCAPGIRPVPNFHGYDYLAKNLAGHGMVVISVSANGINAGSDDPNDDEFAARTALVNKHLEMWKQLATSGSGPLAGKVVDPRTHAPRAIDFRGHVDLTDVGTLGHSKGGRGIMNHAADEHQNLLPAGVRLKAVIPMEPIPSGGDDTVTKIPFGSFIGACDIVSNPATRDYLENARGENTVRLHQFFVHGANHVFFNTVWSPSSGEVTVDDDANDQATPPLPAPGNCRTTDPSHVDEKQLTEEQQRQIGLGYASAFFRRYLAGDTRWDPMLTGKAHPLSRVGRVDVEIAEPAR